MIEWQPSYLEKKTDITALKALVVNTQDSLDALERRKESATDSALKSVEAQINQKKKELRALEAQINSIENNG